MMYKMFWFLFFFHLWAFPELKRAALYIYFKVNFNMYEEQESDGHCEKAFCLFKDRQVTGILRTSCP